jgi:hypothetical protein
MEETSHIVARSGRIAVHRSCVSYRANGQMGELDRSRVATDVSLGYSSTNARSVRSFDRFAPLVYFAASIS